MIRYRGVVKVRIISTQIETDICAIETHFHETMLVVLSMQCLSERARFINMLSAH